MALDRRDFVKAAAAGLAVTPGWLSSLGAEEPRASAAGGTAPARGASVLQEATERGLDHVRRNPAGEPRDESRP